MLSLPVIAVDPRVSVSAVNSGALAYLKDHPSYSEAPFGGGRRSFFILASERGALLRLRLLRRVELPITLLDAASPLVPGNDNADMVRASPLACSGDFLLRLAGCQSKDLLAEGGRGALAASWFCGRSA